MPRKLNKFQVFEKESPEFPDFTCPHIDDIIGNLEELREMNGKLRDCVGHWQNACEEMQTEIDELESWKKHIKLYVKAYWGEKIQGYISD